MVGSDAITSIVSHGHYSATVLMIAGTEAMNYWNVVSIYQHYLVYPLAELIAIEEPT